MTYSSSIHLALARERQADIVREARRAELARLVSKDKHEGRLVARIAHLLRRGERRRPLPAAG